MTTPTWNVRATDTALVLERPDSGLVTQADADTVYEAVNGFPPEVDPTPQPPAGLSAGHCEILELHTPHRATWVGDDGSFDYWCTGEAMEVVEAAVEPASEPE